MKKIFLLFLGILFISSCSNDSESTNFNEVGLTPRENLKIKNGDEFEKSYKMMIASQEYINFNSGIEVFIDKMNYTGDGSDLEDQSKMLNWISNNISKTNFNTIGNAVADLDEINNNSILVLKNHEYFFSNLNGSIDIFVDLLNSDDTPPFANSECQRECGLDRSVCRASINIRYSNTIDRLWEMEGTFTDLGALAFIGAKVNHLYGLAQCNKTYNACIAACK